MAVNKYKSVFYEPVYLTENTFKQPRQKMWGVFVVDEVKGGANSWILAYASNDFNGAKEFFNAWLQDPQVEAKYAGMDNIIMVEIIPVNSNVRV